jgi:DNA-binding MarR family transcriptional regulator
VPLNISTTQSDAGAKPVAAGAKRRSQTKANPLVAQVVDELTSWNPREFMAAFQRWHQGSVSLVHLNVLTLLEASGPMSMGRLAEALDISVASITGVVDRMEARGLVERRRDAQDRRVILVHTGPGGRRLFDDIGRLRRQNLTKLLEQLGEPELHGLLVGHRALRTARDELRRRVNAGEIEAIEKKAKDRSERAR